MFSHDIMKIKAKAYQVPLYKHITDLSGKTNPTLLIPAFTVISGGKHLGSIMAIQVRFLLEFSFLDIVVSVLPVLPPLGLCPFHLTK